MAGHLCYSPIHIRSWRPGSLRQSNRLAVAKGQSRLWASVWFCLSTKGDQQTGSPWRLRRFSLSSQRELLRGQSSSGSRRDRHPRESGRHFLLSTRWRMRMRLRFSPASRYSVVRRFRLAHSARFREPALRYRLRTELKFRCSVSDQSVLGTRSGICRHAEPPLTGE